MADKYMNLSFECRMHGCQYEELKNLRAEVEALRQDTERFCALFSYMDESGESPWSAIESVKYGERIDAGEPLIDVIREAIDKHLSGEGDWVRWIDVESALRGEEE